MSSTTPRRPAPPPLEANDQLVAIVISAGWAVALIVLLALGSSLPRADRWWIWTCAAGLALGLFGMIYVPYLKRSRARAERRRQQASADRAGNPHGQAQAADDHPGRHPQP